MAPIGMEGTAPSFLLPKSKVILFYYIPSAINLANRKRVK